MTAVALLVALGLQVLRAFLPLVVHLYGTRPGVTSLGMGRFAVGVMLLAWAVPLLYRTAGVRAVTAAAVVVLLVARAVVQAADPPLVLWAGVVGTAAFLWAVPGLLLAASRGPQAGWAAAGLLGGVIVDSAAAGLFRSWDVVWQRSLLPAAVALGLIVAAGVQVARWWPSVAGLEACSLRPGGVGLGGRRGTSVRAETVASRGGGGGWSVWALGPWLFLYLLVLQSPARVAAGTGLAFPAALTLVLAASALGMGVTLHGSAGLSHRLRAASAVGLAPAAWAAHGTGVLAAVGVAAGHACAAVALAALLRPLAAARPSPTRTAAGWAAGVLAFALFAFLYYVVYDLRLPFENDVLPPLAAGLVGAAVLLESRRGTAADASPGAPAPAPSRAAVRLAVGALVVPLLLVLPRGTSPVRAGGGWPVRVMSYNLHQGYGMSGMQDLEALADTIEATGADVVGLQEVARGWVIDGSTDMLGWLAHRLRAAVAWAPAADASFGNAILSRRAIAARGWAPLPRAGVPMRRSALWAVLDLGDGERLLVVNAHLHHLEAEGQVRVVQVEALARLWGGRAPAVVLGDLNARPGAPELAVLERAGLRDAFRLAGRGDGFTFRADRPYERIDYIWITPDLAARDFEVAPGTASDHRGIAVTLSR